MDNRAYWVWLQQALGEGSYLPWKLHRDYPGGVEEFYQGGPRLWNTRRDISDQKAEGLYHFTLDAAQARLEYALKMGWQVLTPECGEYPECLRNIPDPPAVLYVQGRLPDLDSGPAIAVTGARNAWESSIRAAERIGYQLAAGDAVVVSGEAKGVDSAALKGALSARGRTVCVLPVDLDSPYLLESANLRRSIPQRGGALVTEYFTQRNPNKGTFPQRNRIITGLSCGVLLLQAKLKSGTMIYARHAKEQNRDVFVCLDRAAGPEGQEGCLSLLEDGAKAVDSGEEILAEYQLRFARRGPALVENPFRGIFREAERPAPEPVRRLADSGPAEKTPAPAALPQDLSPEAEQLLTALGSETLAVAQLAERTGLPAARLLALLTQLEMEDLVESLPGKRYRRQGRRI